MEHCLTAFNNRCTNGIKSATLPAAAMTPTASPENTLGVGDGGGAGGSRARLVDGPSTSDFYPRAGWSGCHTGRRLGNSWKNGLDRLC